jgi:tetratricopeptide (TPR) repeat protein
LVFSGALLLIPLAYWLVQPLALQRTIGVQDHWPKIVGVIGLGAISLFFLSSGEGFQQSRALYVGLLLWGAYLVADAATTMLVPRNRMARTIGIVAALAIALLIAAPRIGTIYYTTLSQSASRRALEEPAPINAAPGSSGSSADQAVHAGDVIAQDPQFSADQKAQAYINQGQAYYAVRKYTQAAQAYDQALQIYRQMPEDSEEAREGIAVALAGRARAYQMLGDPRWDHDLTEACSYSSSIAPDCASR